MANSKLKGKAKGRPKRKAPPTNAELKKQLAAAKRKCTGLERTVGRLRTANETSESKHAEAERKSTQAERKSAQLQQQLADLKIDSDSQGTNVNRGHLKNGLQNIGSQGATGCEMHGWAFGYGCNDLAQSRLMEQLLGGSARKEQRNLRSQEDMRDIASDDDRSQVTSDDGRSEVSSHDDRSRESSDGDRSVGTESKEEYKDASPTASGDSGIRGGRSRGGGRERRQRRYDDEDEDEDEE